MANIVQIGNFSSEQSCIKQKIRTFAKKQLCRLPSHRKQNAIHCSRFCHRTPNCCCSVVFRHRKHAGVWISFTRIFRTICGELWGRFSSATRCILWNQALSINFVTKPLWIFVGRKALLFTTPHRSSDGYKAMRPTSIWRLYNRLILRLYYVNSPRATTSVAQV